MILKADGSIKIPKMSCGTTKIETEITCWFKSRQMMLRFLVSNRYLDHNFHLSLSVGSSHRFDWLLRENRSRFCINNIFISAGEFTCEGVSIQTELRYATKRLSDVPRSLTHKYCDDSRLWYKDLFSLTSMPFIISDKMVSSVDSPVILSSRVSFQQVEDPWVQCLGRSIS